MNPFVFNTTKSVVFENGAAERIAALAGGLLGKACLLITDPGLRKLGLCDPCIDALEKAGHQVTVFDDVEADPSRETLMRAVEAGRSAGATGVIGFGGGSSQDVAKLVALLLGSDEDLDAAWGVGQAKGPRLPLVLVPTTAGTGSEVTPVSIITVGAEEKRGVSSPVILPDMAILDASLTVGLPASITAATGVDAMVHAIESYASVNANNNPVSKLLAREALRLLGANIETVVADGSNLEARGAMLLGLCWRGKPLPMRPSRRYTRWPIPSVAPSISRTGCPTRWCCPTCCASTRPKRAVSMPRSLPMPSPTWQRSKAVRRAPPPSLMR